MYIAANFVLKYFVSKICSNLIALTGKLKALESLISRKKHFRSV